MLDIPLKYDIDFIWGDKMKKIIKFLVTIFMIIVMLSGCASMLTTRPKSSVAAVCVGLALWVLL